MNYKIIVPDLDGTLTNRGKIITPRTEKTPVEAQETRNVVVPALGRPMPGVKPLAKEFEVDCFGNYILSYNGGMITNCKTGEVAFTSFLPLESNQKIIGLVEEHRVDILIYQGGDIIINNKECPYVVVEPNINHLLLRQVEDMRPYADFQVPKFLVPDDGDYLVTVEPRVKAAVGRDFNMYHSEEYPLEVMSKEIDKAQPLKRLLHILGLEREQMIAYGDGYNDLTTIKYAGSGVAMENAVLPVRNAVDYTIVSSNQDEVGLVVERFMLGRA